MFLLNSLSIRGPTIIQRIQVRFATNMSGGQCKNHGGSPGQRLGVKKLGGQKVDISNILIRQRGSRWYAGENVSRGNDDTLFATCKGTVKFTKELTRLGERVFIHVIPENAYNNPREISETIRPICQ